MWNRLVYMEYAIVAQLIAVAYIILNAEHTCDSAIS